MSEDRRLRVALLGDPDRAGPWAAALTGRAELRPPPDDLDDIDAVVVAPGADDPFTRAKEALTAGVPVLYAAPFRLSPWQAAVLDGLSREQRRILRFVEPYQYRRGYSFLRRLLEGREPFWRPLYLRTLCLAEPSSTTRLDDLATEELAICDGLLDGAPQQVTASAARRDETGEVCAVFLTVQYQGGGDPLVQCTLSMAEATTVKQLVAVTPERTVMMDELDPCSPLRIVASGEHEDETAADAIHRRQMVLSSTGPDFATGEVTRLFDAIHTGELSAGNSRRWARVAALWWAARQSMSFGGPVDVPEPSSYPRDTATPPLRVIEGGGGVKRTARKRPPLTVVAN